MLFNEVTAGWIQDEELEEVGVRKTRQKLPGIKRRRNEKAVVAEET